MVFFFESSEGYTIYMGRDKYENEDLIRYGLPEDVWFHVDDLSSAHVYLRQKKGEKLDDISETLLSECAQLVKANSIEGCKRKSVAVIYTKWRNLHKTASMEVGSIGFKDRSKLRRLTVEKHNPTVNDLNRTKREEHPDLAALQEERAREFRAEQKRLKKQKEAQEKQAARKRAEEAELRSYTSMMNADNMQSNDAHAASADASAAAEFEEDFM